MTDKIVVRDVGALDQFASQLSRAQASLEQVRNLLTSALGQVSSSWQDPQRDRVAEQIEGLSRTITTFSNQAGQHVAYCKRLAAHLRSTPR